MAFANRLAILVGGVGGIGNVTGKLLHSQGAKLALLYAPFEKDQVKSKISEVYGDGAGKDINSYECDIVSPDSVTHAFEAIAKDNVAFPSILVNTAGYVNLTALETFPPEDALKHYMINLFGPTLTSQAFARLYMSRLMDQKQSQTPAPGGRIVNIASQAAHIALDHHGPYCASKAGLIGLTKCMANEWGPHGITANTISPGPVWTAMGKKAWADQTQREAYLANVPSGKFAEPEEVARIVAFLCEEDAKNINGTDIGLDGGYTVR